MAKRNWQIVRIEKKYFDLIFCLGSITHESQPSSAAEDALARYQERISIKIGIDLKGPERLMKWDASVR